MLTDLPSWTDIQNANATFSAMIAAWVSAGETCVAVIFAAIAVYWAKGAVAQASRQANAAIEESELFSV